MQLNEFQNRFKELMLDHPKALENPPEDLAAFCDVKTGGGNINLPTRLKVYRNNIVGTLTDLMLTTFPVMEKLVGKDFLEGMSRSFILENPPNQGCLSLYGDGFAEFVEEFELAKSLPYLPDIARLELALNKAYYAQDDTALTAEELSNVAPEELEDLQLSLRDSVHLVSSRYPLTAIRDFCMAETQDGKLDLDQGSEKLIIYRPQLESVTALLESGEYLMLNNLANEQTLGKAVENVMNVQDDFDFQVFLQKHLALETFKALASNT